MSGAVWLWQFVKPVIPAQAQAAVKSAGLGEDWIPVVPFAEVAERAVGKTKAKRTKEPGLLIWTLKGKSWYADLVTESLVFESPRSKVAREISARLDAARALQPRDLSAYLEDVVKDWGGVNLMGPLWVVPDTDGVSEVLSMLRAIPGAAVAAIPLDGAGVAGQVLALLAGRLAAESEGLSTGLKGLKPEALRRRAGMLRGHAEDVASLAGVFGADLSVLGGPLVEAEARIRGLLPGQYYAAPLDFGGGVGGRPVAEQTQAVEFNLEPDGGRPNPEGGYRKAGDPPPEMPALLSAREVKP